MTTLTALENDVTQFVTAMKTARKGLGQRDEASSSAAAAAANTTPNNAAFLSAQANRERVSTAPESAPPTSTADSMPLIDSTAEGPTTPKASTASSCPRDEPHGTRNLTATLSAHLASSTKQIMDDTRRLEDALRGAQQRAQYEQMQKEWLAWGGQLMITLEKWADRPDLDIATRMTVVGLMDRLAWYGVRGS